MDLIRWYGYNILDDMDIMDIAMITKKYYMNLHDMDILDLII
jgi:hypothetical protein